MKPIGELEFRASGWFSVTWTPFETYRDYVGEYSFDPPKHALSLKITGGAFVPRIFHGQGTYKLLDDKTLELRGLYLGSQDEEKPNLRLMGSRPCQPAATSSD